MPTDVITLTRAQARSFMRRLHGLDAPATDIAGPLRRHGYIQIDPINVCGRMHDLILRNRVKGYREGDLMRYLHGEEKQPLAAAQRTAFEHHLPSSHILVAFGLEAWPYLLSTMQERAKEDNAWSGRLTPKEKALADLILEQLQTGTPLCSEDIDDGNERVHSWGHSSLAKVTLQKLFFHGRVLIAARRGQRRYYALPAQVLPESRLHLPPPDKAACARWLVLTRLRQHRLLRLKKSELPLVEDAVQAIDVSDTVSKTSSRTGSRTGTKTASRAGGKTASQGTLRLYCLREDAALLDTTPAASTAGRSLKFLAPLDPLIYDRRLTAALWDFDYIWEVYTPPAKRVRGYYALPVLAHSGLIGHIDPKVDRKSGRLLIQGKSVPDSRSLTKTLREFASFLKAGLPEASTD